MHSEILEEQQERLCDNLIEQSFPNKCPSVISTHISNKDMYCMQSYLNASLQLMRVTVKCSLVWTHPTPPPLSQSHFSRNSNLHLLVNSLALDTCHPLRISNDFQNGGGVGGGGYFLECTCIRGIHFTCTSTVYME